MTKTEQDEKITEWLSWGMHNGVCPEVLTVAALAIGAAQERSQYPHGKAPQEPVILTGNRPEDNASQTAKGLVQSGVPFPSIPSVEDYISSLVTERRNTPGSAPNVADWLKLKDGSKLSVQASRWHYCSPRTDDGPWDKFEVGTETFDQFPELAGWAETGSPVEGASVYVYPHVPAKIIGAIIVRCGGVEDHGRTSPSGRHPNQEQPR